MSGYGLGDVEAGLQYQINKGNNSWPIMVANVKVKIPTGQGPFDVERDATNGLEEELPTGSGFWGIQSSLTFMKTADPLVFYGNINYVFNMASDIDEEISTSNGTALILEVDPGDAIGVSFGGALAITENVSMSLGYEHYYVMATEQTASTFVLFAPPPPVGQPIGFFDAPVTTTGEDAQVGSLLFGVNFRDDEGGSYSMTLSAGLTDDAPDVAVSFRRPFSFDVGSWVE
ncbi:MAG: hypothetical protein H7Z38_17015 [Rubrivivax sp.]|nr:hypothetical protein [Pyrinomonadaceae bacterium]